MSSTANNSTNHKLTHPKPTEWNPFMSQDWKPNHIQVTHDQENINSIPLRRYELRKSSQPTKPELHQQNNQRHHTKNITIVQNLDSANNNGSPHKN